jgi:hypothetical protein
MANSALHKFLAVLETVYGTTPATPALQEYGITGTTLALSKNTIESMRIRSDRQVLDVRDGNRQVGGNIEVEFAYGAFDVLLQALFCGTWTSDVLVPGVIRRSFSVIRNFTDLSGGADAFHRFVGVELNTFTLTLATEAIVKAAFGVIGKDWLIEATAPTDSTYPAVDNTRAFDSFVGSITADGDPIATVSGLTLTIANGITPRFVLFDKTTNPTKIGRTRITGQLTAYFETSDLLQKFKDASLIALEFTMQDPLGNTYAWDLPAIFPNSGQVDVSGENDIVIPLNFTAIFDPGNSKAISLTRTAA